MKASTKIKQFDSKTKKAILLRDRGCIFCKLRFHMECTDDFQMSILDVMHYINKSAGGLGVERNGAIGCRYHHSLLDNGNKGIREEMIGLFKQHLQSHYTDWNEEELYFNKYKEMEEKRCS